MNTLNRKFPISGTKGYSINPLTHEIYNQEGKKMKPFVDSRGRVSTKLMRTDGKQRVFVIKDLVKKVSDTLETKKETLKKGNKLLTYEGFFNNIDTIRKEGSSLDKYVKAKDLIVNADLDILKMLIRTMR